MSFSDMFAMSCYPNKKRIIMGVAAPPPRFEILGGRPPEITTYVENFLRTYQVSKIFQYFRNKVTST